MQKGWRGCVCVCLRERVQQVCFLVCRHVFMALPRLQMQQVELVFKDSIFMFQYLQEVQCLHEHQ